jgi:hypothetical protein
MNSPCSQAQAAESLAENCLDGEPSAPSRSTTIVAGFSCSARMMESLSRSRSGPISAHSTGDLGLDAWISSLADFRARTLAAQAKAPASRESDPAYGKKWHGLFARYDRATHSWKTPHCSLLEDSTSFSGTWPKWGSMRSGACYLRQTPALPTFANGSGSLLPTPTAKANMLAPSMQKWPAHRNLFPTPSASNYGSNQGGAAGRVGPVRYSLHSMARRGMWPTPQAPDWRSGKVSAETMAKNSRPLSEQIGGTLNPEFCEWLMAWPIGFTDLKPLGTGKFRQWFASHGGYSDERKECE